MPQRTTDAGEHLLCISVVHLRWKDGGNDVSRNSRNNRAQFEQLELRCLFGDLTEEEYNAAADDRCG